MTVTTPRPTDAATGAPGSIPFAYQESAVTRALDPENLRPPLSRLQRTPAS